MDTPKGIDLRPGGIRVRFQHQRTPYTRTLALPHSPAGVAQAVRYLEQWKAHVAFGAPHPGGEAPEASSPVTFLELAQDYLDKADVRLSTRNSYRDSLNTYWMPRLARRRADSIRLRDLRDLDRATDWPSLGRRRDALTALRRVLDHGVAEDVLSENAAAGLRVRKVQRDREPDPYSVEERAAILQWVQAHAEGSQRLAVEVAFGTGMRTGEILALRSEDWDGRRLRVARSRVRGEIVDTKTSEVRRVVVGARLRRLLDAHSSQGWLLTTSTGDPYRYPGKAFRAYRAALEALGIRKRTGPYPWRHTYASIGLSTPGVSVKWLAHQLGHSQSVFERVYARWIESEAEEEQAQRMDAAMDERCPEVGPGLKVCRG